MKNKEYQILIIDDQKEIRELLFETCSILGYKALTVASGEEALALVKKHNFQVALVDLQMPGLNGIKTTEELMEQEQNLKVILLTGYSDLDKEMMEIKAQGKVIAVLTKPFALEELQTLLEKNITE